jgi:hypothetical protein
MVVPLNILLAEIGMLLKGKRGTVFTFERPWNMVEDRLSHFPMRWLLRGVRA